MSRTTLSDLSVCCFEIPIGTPLDNNAVRCTSVATVYNLVDECEYCARHQETAANRD